MTRPASKDGCAACPGCGCGRSNGRPAQVAVRHLGRSAPFEGSPVDPRRDRNLLDQGIRSRLLDAAAGVSVRSMPVWSGLLCR